MFHIGPWELVLVLGIALLIFGGRLPQIGKNLGKGIVEFKKGLKGIQEDIENAGEEDTKQLKEAQAKVKEGESKTS